MAAMALTREQILDGELHRAMRNVDPNHMFLSEEELRANQRRFLTDHPAGDDLWVFAYGSLIWNPAFHFIDRCCAQLVGYHRQFCLWTSVGRGTPDRPGLMCGLEPGGSCTGLAYRIEAAAVETETWVLWRREMISGAYVPRRLHLRAGRQSLEALVFVINHEHPRYAGRLPVERIVETIALAEGRLGCNRDYLFSLARDLRAHGITDRPMEELAERVAARCGGAPSPGP